MENVKAAAELLKQAIALLEASEPGATPVITNSRVETVGKVAYLHQKHLIENGNLTVADSREIRRSLFPELSKMRSTANYFGTKNSGAILYRDVPHGTRVKGGHNVALTAEGTKLAKAYKAAHPEA